MAVEVRREAAHARELAPVVAGHFPAQRALHVHHLVMRDGQHVVFGERVHQRERDVLVVELAEPRVELEIVAHVVHPAHIPLEVEAETADVRRARDERPRGRLLGDHHDAGVDGERHAVELAQELDRLDVLVPAVLVGRPLAVAAVVVEVEHRRHGVHAQAVDVEFAQPEGGGGQQEALDLAAAVVEHAGAPAQMLALARVLVLIAARAVEVAQTVGVLAEVGGHPVEDDGHALLVHLVHKVHEVLGRAVAARRGKVARDLIAPGRVEGILGDGHQLHAVVAEVRHVCRQLVGEGAVVVERAVFAPAP